MNEPVAWGIDCDGKLLATYTCEDEESAREMVARFSLSGIGNIAAIPLYRQPQPAITDAEREAIETAMNAYGSHNANPECAAIEATLWGLLERTK